MNNRPETEHDSLVEWAKTDLGELRLAKWSVRLGFQHVPLFLLLCACAQTVHADKVARTLSASPLPPGTAVPISGLAIACTSYAISGLGPPTYLVADIGKRGMPNLSHAQLALIHKIVSDVRSPTLRFTFVNRPKLGVEHLGQLIVFDANKGPCFGGAGGYEVLNGCVNEEYEPGEDPTTTFPGSTGIYTKPGPWMSGFVDPLCP